MDDSTTIGIKLVADAPVKNTFGTAVLPVLWVVCKDGKTLVKFDLGVLLNSEVRSWESTEAYGYRSGVAIRLRLDQDKPITHFGDEGSDNTSVFLKNPVNVIKKMIGKSSLLLEYTPIASPPRTVGFTITGIGEAIGEVRKSCRW